MDDDNNYDNDRAQALESNGSGELKMFVQHFPHFKFMWIFFSTAQGHCGLIN